jgi:hypothetical protein
MVYELISGIIEMKWMMPTKERMQKGDEFFPFQFEINDG